MSHVRHVIQFSVRPNDNLDVGVNGRAIKSNWGINCSNQKFREDIEKVVKIRSGKM